MAKRKPITKKLRFEVFKRDVFTCQYCGATPPSVVLELDHIIPVAQGGDDSEGNLICACFDCNRGKGDRLLTAGPVSIELKAEILKEKAEQLRAYEDLLAEQRMLREGYALRIEDLFRDYTGYDFSDRFMTSVQQFLKKLHFDEMVDAMDIACSKIEDPERALKYFCGICWSKIRERENG